MKKKKIFSETRTRQADDADSSEDEIMKHDSESYCSSNFNDDLETFSEPEVKKARIEANKAVTTSKAIADTFKKTVLPREKTAETRKQHLTITEFEKLEKATFKTLKDKLACPQCKKTGLINNGVSGNLNTQGVRRLAVRCTGCNKNTQLHIVLSTGGCDKERDWLDRALAKMPTRQKSKERKEVNNIKKTTSSPVLTDFSEDDEETTSDLEAENERLREQVEVLTRELTAVNKQMQERQRDTDQKISDLYRIFQDFLDTQPQPQVADDIPSSNHAAPWQDKGKWKAGAEKPYSATHATRASSSNNTSKDEQRRDGLIQERRKEEKKKERNNQVKRKEGTQQQATYAAAAKKNHVQETKKTQSTGQKRRQIAKLLSCVQEKPQPMTFRRVYFTARKPKGTASRGQRMRQIVQTLIALGIKKHVVDFSLIGSQVVEIYVPEHAYEKVIGKLEDHAVLILENFDPLAKPHFENAKQPPRENIARRLGRLIARNTVRNMRQCILEPYDKTMVDLSFQEAERITSGKTAASEEERMEVDEDLDQEEETRTYKEYEHFKKDTQDAAPAAGCNV